ncbi:MAG: extracellular solute-binding protein, partial [Candidatus Atribacteria bacterium]|nr:extracellular solute-binding protein [Candidatus Atribacteria bacterium]
FEHEMYKEYIMNTMSARQAADINILLAGPKYSHVLAEAGRILNLDPYYKKYNWENVLVEGNKIQKYQDHYYFVTQNWISVPWVYYNVGIFDKLGLSEPKTEEDLYNLVKTLKANGYEGIALGTMVPNYAEHFISGFLPRFITRNEFQDLMFCYQKNYQGIKWNDPRILDAFKNFKKWVDDEIFVKGMNGMDDSIARSLFINGKAAMYQGGSWVPGLLISEAPNLKFNAFLYPQIKKDIPVTTDAIMCNGYVVSADTKYPDACGEFLNFMLSHESQKLFLKEYGIFPTRRDFSEDELKSLVNETQLKIINSPGLYETTDSLQIWLTPDIMEPYLRILQEVISGQLTPEDAVNQLEKNVEEARSKN